MGPCNFEDPPACPVFRTNPIPYEFTLVLQRDRNNHRNHGLDWGAEWGDLRNNESRAAEKEGTESGSGFSGAPPSFTTTPRSLTDTLLSRFNMEVLSQRRERTAADLLERVEPTEIEMFLNFCTKPPPPGGDGLSRYITSLFSPGTRG